MAVDTRYDNNIVLKEEAFQNLLTNIKNYPIVDIDYVSEGDTDELHGDYIWDNYTNGVPCIKITYGNDRTTKGNNIFSSEEKEQINKNKKKINAIQIVINELTKRKNRWTEVYNQNYALYQNKDNQVKRFIQNFNDIESNKLKFLKAGWDLLYFQQNLNIDDPYQVVQVNTADATSTEEKKAIIKTAYNQEKVYYIHSDEYLFERYTFNGYDVSKMTSSHSNYNEMLDDWAEKVLNNEIYLKNSTDRGPVILQELGPQNFSYTNIVLEANQNQYTLVSTQADYDQNLVYYTRNADTKNFTLYLDQDAILRYEQVPVGSTYDSTIVYYVYDSTTDTYSVFNRSIDLWNSQVGNGDIYTERSNYYSLIEEWETKRDNYELYTKKPVDQNIKTYNLEYSALNSDRAILISQLLTLRNSEDSNGNSIWTSPQKEVITDFINFIHAYNRLVFYDTIGIAGYTDADIELLKARYPTIRDMLKYFEDPDNSIDFEYEEQTDEDLDGVYSKFRTNIEDIVNKINNIINVNLEYIRNQVQSLNYSIMQQNAMVDDLEAQNKELEEAIQAAASERYDLVQPTENYNQAKEYFTKSPIDDSYIPYEGIGADWETGVQNGVVYVKNDRTMYGYKYVKVGYRVLFEDTYINDGKDGKGYTLAEQGLTTPELERFDSASRQASGTFRITINGHIYEVPIKGFTAVPSNQPIYITTNNKNEVYKQVTNADEHNPFEIYYYLTEANKYEKKAYPTNNTDWRNDVLAGKVFTLDEIEHGSINFLGNLLGSGNIVTNNGNIYASGGAVGASTYQAMRGYPIKNDGTPIGDFSPDKTGGLWYDGTNKLIRTWNITDDKDDVGLGCYQLVLISKDKENSNDADDSGKSIGNGNRLGIIGNGNTIEFHTGLPSTSNTTNNNLANIKAGNLNLMGDIIIGNGDPNPTSYKLEINGKDLSALGTGGTKGQFFRGDRSWTNTLEGDLILGTSTVTSGVRLGIWGDGDTNANGDFAASVSIHTKGGIKADKNIWGNKVFKAVFNDYAEYRQTINLTPGHIVIDNDDGSLSCTFKRLQPGAQIISDTFGDAMGYSEKCQTPIAVAGRVLAYTYQPRENYHAGMAVCSAPDGTIDIMTREEIREYPDCIIGIVSEIPNYEKWGTDQVNVDGRIWIRIK